MSYGNSCEPKFDIELSRARKSFDPMTNLLRPCEPTESLSLTSGNCSSQFFKFQYRKQDKCGVLIKLRKIITRSEIHGQLHKSRKLYVENTRKTAILSKKTKCDTFSSSSWMQCEAEERERERVDRSSSCEEEE